MGKSTQYRNWCVTWDADDISYVIPQTDQNGSTITVGCHTMLIYVGPQEDTDDSTKGTHNHILVHCETGAITKSKVREALSTYTGLQEEEVTKRILYLARLETNKQSYLQYAWKTQYNSTTSKDDEIVKSTIENLKEERRVPTVRTVKRKLIEDYGANAFNKRFCKIAETYISQTDIVDNRGNPIVKFDGVQNIVNYVYSLLVWRLLITKTNCVTTFKGLKDCPILTDFTFLLSIIPYFSKRVYGTSDLLPALYMWGVQGAGKSSMYNNCKYIKKIASDAQGVNRFKLEFYHTGILFDDVDSDIIEDKTNACTMKQLTLGDPTQVKINGDVQEIRAFVVVTSNAKPKFIEDCYETDKTIIYASWKRRFICCEFSDVCAFDMNAIDYDDLQLRTMAAIFFKKQFDVLYKTEANQKFLNLLKTYYDVAVNDYTNNDTDLETFKACMDTARSKLKEDIDEARAYTTIDYNEVVYNE